MREDEWCALVKRLKMMSGKRKSFVQSFADKTHHLEAAIQSMQAHASAVGSDVDGKWGEVGGSSVSSRTSRRSRSHPGSSHPGCQGYGPALLDEGCIWAVSKDFSGFEQLDGL